MQDLSTIHPPPTATTRPALHLHDPRSLDLLCYADRIAPSEATVLIDGETGTGKELLARHVHARSRRRGPFIAVNCGALSESLIDAELFGHEAGAYTGASHARAGWFEAANGGTLFLDEIGDMPLALQVKLLRVLQERQVVRLGSRRAQRVDVRLVAATNVDLPRAIDAGRFRADLYYRLNVVSLTLPPLRDRPGDILPLARHFIATVGTRRSDAPPPVLAPDAEEALLRHRWPGNVRELENVLHLALIFCRDGRIVAGDLQFAEPELAEVEAVVDPVEAPGSMATDAHDLERLVRLLQDLVTDATPKLHARIEEALVTVAFAHCEQNQVRTAKLLGVSRNTARTLLKRHGLRGN